MAVDEVNTLATFNDSRDEIIKPKTSAFGGHIINFMRDGTLMEFGSVAVAVSFTVDIQRGGKERQASLFGDSFRATVHRCCPD